MVAERDAESAAGAVEEPGTHPRRMLDRYEPDEARPVGSSSPSLESNPYLVR